MSSDSVNGSNPKVSSSRATRIAIARESSPELSKTRSSVNRGKFLFPSCAICCSCEIIVDFIDIHPSCFRLLANTVVGGSEVALDDSRGVSSDKRPRGHIAGDPARGGDYAVVPDCYSCQY